MKYPHLQQTFEENGYPPQIVHEVLHKLSQFPVPGMEEKVKTKILTLPYIKGFSEKTERAVRPLSNRAVFKTQITIQQEEIKDVLYEVLCECGAVYIHVGETGAQTCCC